VSWRIEHNFLLSRQIRLDLRNEVIMPPQKGQGVSCFLGLNCNKKLIILFYFMNCTVTNQVRRTESLFRSNSHPISQKKFPPYPASLRSVVLSPHSLSGLLFICLDHSKELTSLRQYVEFLTYRC
jgi:hypothetical protein